VFIVPTLEILEWVKCLICEIRSNMIYEYGQCRGATQNPR
jgi:hypothetical protein